MNNIIAISRKLSSAVDNLHFGAPITHVYNPLVYARAPHEMYLERYGQSPKVARLAVVAQPLREVVLVGMNPGPFGMAQTGVPFGDVHMVRDWLGICLPITPPDNVHPKRPIHGFDCARREVSGSRLWGFARERFGTPERFFARFLVLNYCPLAFMEISGKNFTPDALPSHEKEPLFIACDEALRNVVKILRPRFVVGVGAFATKRAQAALSGVDVTIGSILHPSPASPKANKGWAKIAEAQLTALGIRGL